MLDVCDIGCVLATCRAFCLAPAPAPASAVALQVAEALRRRARECVPPLWVPVTLPPCTESWVKHLLRRELLHAAGATSPLAAGSPNYLLNHEAQLLRYDDSLGPVSPTTVATTAGVRMASVPADAGHYLALTRNGDVYSWGKGRDGALGYDNYLDKTTPVRSHTVVRVAAGVEHSAAIMAQGALFTWGVVFLGSWLSKVGGRGLGYEVEMGHTPVPMRVEAL